jgi:hypothetical protein
MRLLPGEAGVQQLQHIEVIDSVDEVDRSTIDVKNSFDVARHAVGG